MDPDKEFIFIATQRGAIKKMKIAEFEKTTRAKRGVVMLRELKNNPHRVAGMDIVDNSDIMNVQTEQNNIEQINIAEMRANDRYSNGSFIFDESENGLTVGIWKDTTNKKDTENN